MITTTGTATDGTVWQVKVFDDDRARWCPPCGFSLKQCQDHWRQAGKRCYAHCGHPEWECRIRHSESFRQSVRRPVWTGAGR
jgi:hypothetical protein